MTEPTTTDDSKWWGNSLTVRGALLSAASAALPVIGALAGIDLNGETIRQIGDQTIAVVQAVGGLAGMLMTVVGRTRARQPITRKRFDMKI